VVEFTQAEINTIFEHEKLLRPTGPDGLCGNRRSGVFGCMKTMNEKAANVAALMSVRAAKGATSSTRKAFTLIELLVVLGIIGLLAAMLLPVLQRARGTAKSIQCINNQRQLALVWTLYASDNGDKLVANGIPIRVPTPNIKWVQGAFVFAEDSTNSNWILDPNWALFAHYIKNASTYVCPSYPATVNYLGASSPRIRSYAMNNYLGWEGFLDDRLELDSWKVFQRSTQIDSPSQIFLLQDVNHKSICWPFFGTYMNDESFFNFPSSAHNRGGVVSFTDTHVENHRWKDERTIRAESSDYHVHDDASPGNVDVCWLQQHATHSK
jgi:prepilin-type N-terminal cleavage/methylation domain-containing protein